MNSEISNKNKAGVSFVSGFFILSFSTVLVKILGLVYKIKQSKAANLAVTTQEIPAEDIIELQETDALVDNVSSVDDDIIDF